MGQHTWFYKNKALFIEQQALYAIKDANGWIEQEGEARIREIDLLNRTSYYDCFRTSKRESDGQYCLDTITSKEKCDKWLSDNSEKIYNMDQERLSAFWDEYPDGAIDFG